MFPKEKHDFYSKKDITHTYRFRQCDQSPCPDYFDIFPEFENSPDTCRNRGPKDHRRNTDQRVMNLVEKHFSEVKDYQEEDFGQCPYCFVGSWSDR